MNSIVPALAAAGVVLVAAMLASPGRPTRHVDPERPLPPEPPTPGPLARTGGAIRRRLGAPADPRLDRRAGFMALLCVLSVPLSPMISLLVAGGWTASVVLGRRRRVRRSERDLVDELPEVVDLLNLAVSAGLTVPLAVEVVADHGRGQFALELDRARQSTAVGSELAIELDLITGRLGEPTRPVVRALSGALRDGAPLGPALDRVANDVRTLRRRAAEERARRVSVRLLFPLVCCTLPAFALLTVIPLLISTLRGISL